MDTNAALIMNARDRTDARDLYNDFIITLLLFWFSLPRFPKFKRPPCVRARTDWIRIGVPSLAPYSGDRRVKVPISDLFFLLLVASLRKMG